MIMQLKIDHSLKLCKRCGGEFRATHGGRKYCSDKCSSKRNRKVNIYACKNCKMGFYSERKKKFCTLKCSAIFRNREHRGATSDYRKPGTIIACKGCGVEMASKDSKHDFCSKNCVSWHAYHLKRAKQHGCHFETVNPLDIFNRDNWICQICGELTLRGVEASNPLYPTIDHIKPMAKQGPHQADNMQCAHLLCNAKKKDKYDEV